MSAGMNVALWPSRHMGSVMEPDLGDPHEAAGVLNPAVARGPDGQLYLLPSREAARVVRRGVSTRPDRRGEKG